MENTRAVASAPFERKSIRMPMRTLLLSAALIASIVSTAEAKNLRKHVAPVSADLHAAITASAQKHGIPPALAHGVIRIESRYNCKARNPRSSATGLMQILPRTARGVGVNGNLHDCATNLEAGMRYLRQAYDAAHGNWCATASLFNRGTAASPICTSYGRKVIQLASLD